MNTTPGSILGVQTSGTLQVPWEFSTNQQTQAKRTRTSQLQVKNFVQFTKPSFFLGTLANNGSMLISTSLTPQSPHATDSTFAIAQVGVFIGTSLASYNGSQQLYPTVGGSQTIGKWDIRGDYDYNGVNGTISGTISVWNGVVINNSGATGTIQFVSRWRYINYNSGTVL
jgi:hypothetical protein